MTPVLIYVIGALGMDCAQLGFDLSNKTSSPPPSVSDDSKSIGKHNSECGHLLALHFTLSNARVYVAKHIETT